MKSKEKLSRNYHRSDVVKFYTSIFMFKLFKKKIEKREKEKKRRRKVGKNVKSNVVKLCKDYYCLCLLSLYYIYGLNGSWTLWERQLRNYSLIKILLSMIRVYLKRVCVSSVKSVSYPINWVLFMGWLGKWLTTLRILIYPFVYFSFYTNLYPKCYPYPTVLLYSLLAFEHPDIMMAKWEYQMCGWGSDHPSIRLIE